MMNTLFLTDGYKLDHRRQYPEGTEYIQANWTPRSNNHYPEANEGAVVFGLSYVVDKYLVEDFNKNFFSRPLEEVVNEYKTMLDLYLCQHDITIEHIEELHKLGYLPIKIQGLPEGAVCPIGIPAFTVINTNPRFYWLVNYIETLLSNQLWLPMTSATTARLYKKELYRHCEKVGMNKDDVDFLCHDFSMRGMAGIEATILSGLGHLTSFSGTESIPALMEAKRYHREDDRLIATTIPATEHSVMCSGGKEDELQTFRRLITEVYPNGFVSIVSDTWDFWKVISEYTKELKGEILSRDGRVVFRPDSGTPEDIICGKGSSTDPNERKGAYEILWDIFGGTINEKGYKVLNPKVGLIYGDSITLERQKEIYKRLEEKGFSASNLVLGIGSYTYQYKTRDSLGFAMKSTWVQVNGESREIFKQPKTDDGTKVSAKGYLDVIDIEDRYELVTIDRSRPNWEDSVPAFASAYVEYFSDGEAKRKFDLHKVRKVINDNLK